jgi:hypothetical protein
MLNLIIHFNNFTIINFIVKLTSAFKLKIYKCCILSLIILYISLITYINIIIRFNYTK